MRALPQSFVGEWKGDMRQLAHRQRRREEKKTYEKNTKFFGGCGGRGGQHGDNVSRFGEEAKTGHDNIFEIFFLVKGTKYAG